MPKLKRSLGSADHAILRHKFRRFRSVELTLLRWPLARTMDGCKIEVVKVVTAMDLGKMVGLLHKEAAQKVNLEAIKQICNLSGRTADELRELLPSSIPNGAA